MPLPKLLPNPALCLARWHQMVAQGDLSALAELLDAQVVFRSPMAHAPYSGAPIVAAILSTVSAVFEDFAYHRQMAADDGLNVTLEFSARIAGRDLKGVDLIRFNESGKIVEFEVMVRPMSGLQALGDEMGKRLAPYLAAAKRQG